MSAETAKTGNRENSNKWLPVGFAALDGWHEDDHEAALSCFRLSARAILTKSLEARVAGLLGRAFVTVAKAALDLDADKTGRQHARSFFEEHFQPFRHQTSSGFVTGYFEPVVEASRERSGKFTIPVFGKPDDLVKIDPANRPPVLSSEFEFGRKTSNGVEEYFDRAQIENGALSGRGLELFWMQSAVDLFFVHIQGSARLLLRSGEEARISYAGKTGHPYTAIGKLLIQRGELSKDALTMTTIRNWLAKNPERGRALMQENRSFIFFKELENHDPQFGPVAAAGIQLTPGRSIAVDNAIHEYGTPVWIATDKPLPATANPMQRLMVAQDTGSAIIGPERGDLFIGSGREAGEIAGAIKHDADFTILLPHGASTQDAG